MRFLKKMMAVSIGVVVIAATGLDGDHAGLCFILSCLGLLSSAVCAYYLGILD